MTRTIAAVLVAVLAAAPLAAQSDADSPAPCSTPEHRQFDFWIGEWEVTADGRVAGHNKITRLFGDCGLREEYTGTRGGYTGSSFNLYDASRGLWHQTWVDNQGTLLLLDGTLEEGRMVLEGDLIGSDGLSQHQRITWTPNGDGTVRQHWEQSADGGGTWTTVFDGLYRKKAATP